MKERVLILGGTGAMGKALVPMLKQKYDVFVTSRSKHVNEENVTYYEGDAHNISFLKDLLREDEKFDVIIDFMNYKLDEFSAIVNVILPQTDHYIFMSSARVYAPSDTILKEDSPRLLDVCKDEVFLESNDYALTKAKEENILLFSSNNNWTIIRPGLTYNYNRLQFALWEKEEWLYRAIKGKKVIFPEEMKQIYTTLTYAEDVADVIACLVNNPKAKRECFHIAGATPVCWEMIYNIYNKAVCRNIGIPIRIVDACSAEEIAHKFNRFYQYKYARGIDRTFDNTKLLNAIGDYSFVSVEDGLDKCINFFFESGGEFSQISWLKEASFDRITGDSASFCEFSGIKSKIGYYMSRYSGTVNKILQSL